MEALVPSTPNPVRVVYLVRGRRNRRRVQEYLDRAIRNWRHRVRAGQPLASAYVDAFQAVRDSLLGETLPPETSVCDDEHCPCKRGVLA